MFIMFEILTFILQKRMNSLQQAFIHSAEPSEACLITDVRNFKGCWLRYVFITTVRKARLERSNDGSRSAGEGLCVLVFPFHDTTRTLKWNTSSYIFYLVISSDSIKLKGFNDICASLKYENE